MFIKIKLAFADDDSDEEEESIRNDTESPIPFVLDDALINLNNIVGVLNNKSGYANIMLKKTKAVLPTRMDYYEFVREYKKINSYNKINGLLDVMAYRYDENGEVIQPSVRLCCEIESIEQILPTENENECRICIDDDTDYFATNGLEVMQEFLELESGEKVVELNYEEKLE